MLRKGKNILTILLSGTLFYACSPGGDNPGYEYMPEMVHSVAYDAHSENPNYSNGYTNQLPVEGAVAVGKYTYPLPNTAEGYERAATEIHDSFNFTEDEISKSGKMLYLRYCAICHGEKGDGQGHLVEIDKFPPPPSYFSDDLMSKPEGQRYHTVMYGKGMMGSHASQLDHKERWLVLSYVKSMQDAQSGGSDESTDNDSDN